MARRGHVLMITEALVLSLAPAAFCQIPEPEPLAQLPRNEVAPPGLTNVAAYTGELTPFGYRPPTIPSDWIIPNYYPYLVPRPVYVPVPVAPSRPTLEAVLVDIISLRAGAPLSNLRVRRDTVVTWMNAGDHDLNLVIEPRGITGTSAWDSRHSLS